MADNLMVGSHKSSNKKWDEGWERIFGKKCNGCEDCDCEKVVTGNGAEPPDGVIKTKKEPKDETE